MKLKNKLFIIVIALVIPFSVESVMSFMDADLMSFSTELLNNKLSQDSEAGLAYRLKELNYNVIVDWINKTPIYLWIIGDGISITHGVFSFTFCATGLIGFLYFVITHFKMMIFYFRRSRLNMFVTISILIFFLNDIVTNSRFIIGANTLIYMGLLAFLNGTSSMIKENNNKMRYKIVK